MTDTFLADDVYNRLVSALANVERDLETGEIDACAVKLALGEVAGIFPASVEEIDIVAVSQH